MTSRSAERRTSGNRPPNLRSQDQAAGPCCGSCGRWSTSDGEMGFCFRANGPKRAPLTAFYKVCDEHGCQVPPEATRLEDDEADHFIYCQALADQAPHHCPAADAEDQDDTCPLTDGPCAAVRS